MSKDIKNILEITFPDDGVSVLSLQNYLFRKREKKGVKYRHNLKYIEKINVLN